MRHGMRESRLYRCVWTPMKQRCLNPMAKDFPRYGGRGVGICDRWKESFPAFYEDMRDPPTKRHTIDRIDNSKGYSKENCRWALPVDQTRNRRISITPTFQGVTKPLIEWAKEFRINYITLHARITRYGMSFEKAISKPNRRKH